MFQNAAKRILVEQENDQHNNLHRKIFAYVYVPITQYFVDMWNNQRIRGQKD